MKIYFNAPMPGKIFEICISEGENIEKGQPLIILDSMKMLNKLLAEKDGTIISIKTKTGDFVSTQEVLLEIDEK
jgi:biotin carboxyl carrier protein